MSRVERFHRGIRLDAINESYRVDLEIDYIAIVLAQTVLAL